MELIIRLPKKSIEQVKSKHNDPSIRRVIDYKEAFYEAVTNTVYLFSVDSNHRNLLIGSLPFAFIELKPDVGLYFQGTVELFRKIMNPTEMFILQVQVSQEVFFQHYGNLISIL
jgi:hypothetical protein